MKRCLYCYQSLGKDEIDFHSSCSKIFFGQAGPPEMPYTEAQMEKLAEQVVRSHITVPGVQPKISLDLSPSQNKNEPKRFTIVGLSGGYILKPPTKNFPQLPEVEDLTMHLAEIAKIKVVPHSLIRLQSGSLAYITKRIDRVKKTKLQMEDMCQLTERLTEEKYNGSYEQVAKTILKYSINPGLDVVNFFEQLFFSYVTGNADMHLKNFSLIRPSRMNSSGFILSPVPIYITFGFAESIAIELTAELGKPVFINVHALAPTPPVVDFHNPPEEAPINTVPVSTG